MKQYLKYANIAAIALFTFGFVLFSSSLALTIIVITRGHVGKPAYAANGDIAWPAQDGGGASNGDNTGETAITASNVQNMAKLWEVATPHVADDAIVEQPNVVTPQGTMDLVFVNTTYGNLIAYNAWTGQKIWEADPSSANYNGQGTKSTPAIDPSGNYIYAYALDGYVHKYNIGTGAQVTGNGFPAQVTLLPNDTEKGSASLNIGGGYLYMMLSGNDGDYGHYVGHIVAINLSTGAKTVWNAECSNISQLLDANSSDSNYCPDDESGMWGRTGVKIDPVTGNIFAATGNGLYNANSGGHDWGDSLVELKPDLSQMIDSFTPTNYSTLDSADEDLGSTSPVLLPTQSSSNTPYMAVQGGKDRTVRLLNRANLSGQGGPGHTGGALQSLSISDEMHETPAEWTDPSGNAWVFVTDESADLYAYELVTTSGTSKLVQKYTENIGASTSPFIANGVMYIDGGDSVIALNPANGNILFDSGNIGVNIGSHWNSPVVVNGLLFTPDFNGNLVALYVPGVSEVSPTIPTSLRATAATSSSISLTWTGSTDPHGPGIAGYKLYRNGSAVATISGASTTSYTDTGLSGSTMYNYTVSAYDSNNVEGGQSTSLSAGTVGANIPGDLNQDGVVGIADLSILLSNYGTNHSIADINNDGTVNLTDLSLLLSHWGQ